jgi:lipopolysaccharide export system protein LptA
MKNRTATFLCLVGLLALASERTLRAQTNTNAVVENDTNTAVTVVAMPVAPNDNTVLPPKPRPPTLIEADGPADFDLTKRRVTYRDNVRVNDPEMKLRCDWLAADLPQDGGHVTNIVAETNVVIDFTDNRGQTNHVTCDRAVYVFEAQTGTTNDTVTFTGNARVENAQGWLTGEPIYWDRANNHLRADNPKMIWRQNFNGAGAETKSPADNTNNLSAPK